MGKNYLIVVLLLIGLDCWSQNLDILPPTITSVSVLGNNQVKINWKKSTTPGVTGYILYRFNNDELNPSYLSIAEDISATSIEYIDINASPDLHAESYKMAAYIGEASNYSLSGDPSSTIFLKEIVFDTCSNQAVLNWTSYEGWSKVQYYTIYRNDEDLKEYDTDLSYSDTTVQLGTGYTYYIKANGGIGATSISNQRTITFTGYQKPDADRFFIYQMTNDGNEARFQVKADIRAELKGYALRLSTNKDGAYELLEMNTDVSSENLSFSHVHNEIPYFYKIAALDPCDSIAGETQRVKPLQLTYQMQDYNLTLNWESSFVDAANEECEVYVSVDNSGFEPKGNQRTFTLNELGTENSERFCFQVQATDGSGNTSLSNEICVTRTPVVDIPNAFTPNGDGKNDYFGPFWKAGDNEISYIKDITVTDFELFVYDRYGNVVFYTDESYKKWGGEINGKNVSEGAYVYYYTYTTSTGKSYKGSGSINVVYP